MTIRVKILLECYNNSIIIYIYILILIGKKRSIKFFHHINCFEKRKKKCTSIYWSSHIYVRVFTIKTKIIFVNMYVYINKSFLSNIRLYQLLLELNYFLTNQMYCLVAWLVYCLYFFI